MVQLRLRGHSKIDWPLRNDTNLILTLTDLLEILYFYRSEQIAMKPCDCECRSKELKTACCISSIWWLAITWHRSMVLAFKMNVNCGMEPARKHSTISMLADSIGATVVKTVSAEMMRNSYNLSLIQSGGAAYWSKRRLFKRCVPLSESIYTECLGSRAVVSSTHQLPVFIYAEMLYLCLLNCCFSQSRYLYGWLDKYRNSATKWVFSYIGILFFLGSALGSVPTPLEKPWKMIGHGIWN